MEFTPGSRPDGPDCTDRAAWGAASTLNQYIAKQFIRSEDDYPADACSPYYYSRAQIDNFQVNTALTGSGNINISGTVSASEVTAGGITLTSRKAFDIPHPTKEGYRLRHICVEGPESAVYFRGRVTNKKEIVLPDYWKKLVDWTPVGSHQSVIVKRFDEQKIYLQSNGGIPIDCFFHVYAERADGERLIAEYEGETFEDYPGDNSQYTCNK
jgi:hypothetical protein